MHDWIEDHGLTAGLIIAVAVIFVVLLVVFLIGGFKAEPPYTTWCDHASAATGQTVANRIYQSNTGDIAVVPADKTC
jgi:hypothetical protein